MTHPRCDVIDCDVCRPDHARGVDEDWVIIWIGSACAELAVRVVARTGRMPGEPEEEVEPEGMERAPEDRER